ncbi:biosynthetic-type acetolactate synthase large subunit [Candidatus Bathyarchaeota archaeon]|nr:biosynthetic-type acetolactate synthase large subunit [Candidatus Bathyarchaeota archaeon]MBS7613089.1 biosynthetic-type acetolactate synthase large subunit [Candidatus Bathyarchaeota archaeon]MBS7617413.1 biosynthetic-type acetolactate synthase large subunit [Candidatus Bathyarchaeota archaeon]
MSGSRALIESLKKEGVKVIFGIPGGAIMPVYDVLYDEKEIRHILMRHEQCAAHAADGYARAVRGPGVCMATSGPGATNLVTGIANAYMDSSPVIAITGQVATHLIGRDAFQETDIIGITTPITKYNYQVRRVEDIPRIVKEAFYIASTGRPGPVLIDVPRDMQTSVADVDFNVKIDIRGYKPNIEPHPLQVKKAVDILVSSERPIILAGGGVHWSKAYGELLTLAELLMAPVATTFMGKGVIPENHPLALGCIGMHGRIEANKSIMAADAILAVGVRFSDRSTGKVDEFCHDAKIIHIDIDPSEIRKNVPVHLPIVADAKIALKAIIDEMIHRGFKREKSEWIKRIEMLKKECEDSEPSKEITAVNAIKLLRKVLPENAIVATEVGQNQMWASLHFRVLKTGTFISSGGLGTMGFGFPASLGAKVAMPDVPVVDIAGDGSFLMTEQDLATSVVEDIPVIVMILNNSSLGMVAQWQRFFFGRRYSHTDLKGVPDFAKLAEAFGARGVRVNSLNELEQVLREAVKSDVTVVIDVPIPREEDVLPIVPPGKSLKDMIC